MYMYNYYIADLWKTHAPEVAGLGSPYPAAQVSYQDLSFLEGTVGVEKHPMGRQDLAELQANTLEVAV